MQSVPAGQAERLLDRATRLLSDVQTATAGTPDERTERRTHELRQTVGVLLLVCERLARTHGNAAMVKVDTNADGTGRATYVVDLKGTDPLSAN